MSNSHNFDQKVVLITGASSGIGAATAIQLSALGAQTVITGRNADRLHAIALQCNQKSTKGLTALEVISDLDNESDSKRLIDETIKKFGRIDVLVNNAALFDTNSNIESPDAIDVFDKIMRTNLRNTFVLTHFAVPHLIKTKGSIVNISSVTAFKPFANALVYCMAKSAIDMLTRGLAQELGPKGVRVNCINPAQIQTPVYAHFGMTVEEENKMWSEVSKKTPLRRPGEADDVAKAVAYFASDDSSFATGVSLKLDGGFMDSPQFIFS
ncbi:4-formylbenzenesulfonate dehydrogenase TsaC1/TsaC2-like [Oppia nitens]|uniref:4-formylbenzenesulfonate dehydrogenase TsaC1/TsaC2-like n=1 Tax=Oppia nitens TaxID=1686743 RepID=UPI0023DA7C45|nr:4-formylbenzenesulfonate dehydrogenase TsaC1/TsaC2-like [Oppia nitens]